jgi:hypothetical protein
VNRLAGGLNELSTAFLTMGLPTGSSAVYGGIHRLLALY